MGPVTFGGSPGNSLSFSPPRQPFQPDGADNGMRVSLVHGNRDFLFSVYTFGYETSGHLASSPRSHLPSLRYLLLRCPRH